jgi:rubrerythrin
LSGVNPLNAMLKLALSTAKSQRDFFLRTAENSGMAEVKVLLLVLAESEEGMIEKIQHMMASGILDEIEELYAAEDRGETPDDTPFDPAKVESDPRVYVCSMALEKSIKAYTFYLTMATRAKSEVVSTLFEYLALLEMREIKELRAMCDTF